MINFLEWDSDFFGYKVGEVNSVSNQLAGDIAIAKREKYKLLYFKVDPKNIILNQECIRNNGLLVDEKVTYFRDVPIFESQNNQTELYNDIYSNEKLTNLALQSGVYSRFKVDSNFKDNEFEKLYTTWIEKSVSKQISKELIIQKKDDIVIGLLTLGIKNERADIGLLAVDEFYRGNNIGLNLVRRAFQESHKLKMTYIQVVTQKSNKIACLFYEKMGFTIDSVENIYHFWI